MTVQVDEPTIREFIQIISGHVTQIINGHAVRGVLQVSSLHPASKKLVPSRFRIDDIDTIITAAVGAANAGSNVYLEARLVRPDLQGAARGGLDDTVLSFGLVVDGDNDKGRPAPSRSARASWSKRARKISIIGICSTVRSRRSRRG
jgi:hypothetical protein